MKIGVLALQGAFREHAEALAAQTADHGLLVAATRLDADPLDLALPQPGGQSLVPLLAVRDLQLLVRTSIQRHIELAFASIDAGANYAMLPHLPRTFLECEP